MEIYAARLFQFVEFECNSRSDYYTVSSDMQGINLYVKKFKFTAITVMFIVFLVNKYIFLKKCELHLTIRSATTKETFSD